MDSKDDDEDGGDLNGRTKRSGQNQQRFNLYPQSVMAKSTEKSRKRTSKHLKLTLTFRFKHFWLLFVVVDLLPLNHFGPLPFPVPPVWWYQALRKLVGNGYGCLFLRVF